MNSIKERWVQSCHHKLLDRTLIWNDHHLRHALREYEQFYNSHRAHQAMRQLHCAQSPSPPPSQGESPTWTYADTTDSAASSTSTYTPLELPGCAYENQTAGGDRRLPLAMQHPVADAARVRIGRLAQSAVARASATLQRVCVRS